MAYKVVLIDDNVTTVKSLQMTIGWNNLGFEIAGVAYDGLKGLNLIRELNPDVVITDIQMPNLDGLMMVEQTRELLENARVIVITGYDKFQYAAQAIRLSVFDYVLKPIDNEELKKSLIRAAQSLDKERKKLDRMNQISLYQQRTNLLSLLSGNHDDDENPVYQLAGEELHAYFVVVISAEGGIPRPMLQRLDDTLFPENLRVISVISGRELVLFCGLRKAQEQWRNYAQHVVIQLQDIMPEIMTAISAIHTEPYEIDTAYHEAKQVLIGYGALEHSESVNFYDSALLSLDRHARLADLEQECDSLAEKFDQKSSEETWHDLMKNYDGEIRVLQVMLMMYGTNILRRKVPNTHWPEALAGVIFDISGITSEREARIWLDRFCKEVCRTSGVSVLIGNVLNYVKAHVTEGLRMENVAAQFHVSPAYLSARIRKETGSTYQQHVLSSKIAVAKQLLDDTRMRIEDIAYSIGYENYISFYNTFKRLEGMTPSEYRFRNCKDDVEAEK